MDMHRCPWCGTDPLYCRYHDEEWGVPVYDDEKMFEFLVLETFQAGLSWITVLRKREAFRDAFFNFQPEKMASMGEGEINALMQNTGIIRNRAKIVGAIQNARSYLSWAEKGSSFAELLWSFTGGQPIVNNHTGMHQVPATTDISDRLSKNLKQMGFAFVGSTVCYAHMQATGMVNDHLTTCFRHPNNHHFANG
jgi:DNA-3-methyladenine glycosylase I